MIDRLKIGVGNLVKELRHRKPPINEATVSKNEVPFTDFLSKLNESEQKSVTDFLGFIANLGMQNDMPPLAVTAFGSVLKHKKDDLGEDLPPEDIDLRVHTQTLPESEERKGAVEKITDAISKYFTEQGVRYNAYPSTPDRIVSKDQHGHNVTWLDYDNSDPSFETKPANTDQKPLHISISGPYSYPLNTHIYMERKQGTHFSLLLSPSSIDAVKHIQSRSQ